ncbi:hypothetical protein EX30DRAFT_372449 [Ascodesmis nigricans]|uniref:Protein SQS1 n=1 Tax=Ascodesmis nigricans TaxID=341454 RepID=A0A4S2MUL6_9PEZI|nr:hypothetical protein EX30DRAFT_372449 [Ascodesmis nigricans]
MSFVSAGALQPSELLKPMHPEHPPDTLSGEEAEEDEAAIAVVEVDEVDGDGDSPMAEADSSEEKKLLAEIDVSRIELDVEMEIPKEEETPTPAAFVLDLVGDPSIVPKARSPSPAPSNGSSSGSEKILFVPRNRRTGPSPSLDRKRSPAKKAKARSPSIEPAPRVGERIVRVITTEEKVINTSTVTTFPSVVQAKETKPEEDDAFISISKLPGSSWNGQRSMPGNKRRGKRGGRKKQADEDGEAIEDYMENIAAQMRAEAAEQAGESGEAGPPSKASSKFDNNKFTSRDIGGDEWIDESTDEEEAASDDQAIYRYNNGWSDDDLADFDAFSTDEEGNKGVVDMILRKRTRPSGLQYLIKWENESVDDATWVLAGSMDSSADIKIKIFEEQAATVAAAGSSSEDSDDEDNGEEDEEEDEDDFEGMDSDADLKLAQLLQRQEELAFMGVEDGMSEMEAEIMEFDDDFFPMSGSGKKSKKQRKKGKTTTWADITPNRRTGNFPSATALAEAFDEFDVMDRDRLSIMLPQRPNRKNKGKIAALNLSDSELESQLTNAWEADRQKKKARKIQRQEMRERGELGKKFQATGKPQLSAKYKEGMTLNEVFDEIREFMMRDHESLALPPMDKFARKTVHNLAGQLFLKSKSVGAGKLRFPTLYKTSRSTLFEADEEAIDSILRHRKFLKRMDVGVSKHGGGGAGGKGPFSGGGGIGKRRDGEVVGHGAPELAADNKGRMMLEKMGYKSGMSLGTERNKGIVVPVVAVVKVSKAGLG